MWCFANLAEYQHRLAHMHPTFRSSINLLTLPLEMVQLRPYLSKAECLKLAPVQLQLLYYPQTVLCLAKHTHEIKHSIWSKNQCFWLILSNKKAQNQNPYLLIL